MMAGLDSISTKMYFNPPTFAAAKKSFQSTNAGHIIRQVSGLLPENTDLLVYA